MKQEYKVQVKEGTNIEKSKAVAYGTRICKLLEKRGNVTCDDIVKDAKNPKTPYHNYFEWDDKVAGHEYRKEQARKLLNSVTIDIVTVDDEPVTARMFYNVVIDDEKKTRAYVHYKEAFAVPTYYNQIIEQAMREALGWNKRYGLYQELAGISKAIDETSKRFKKK
jgi:hypothetical protein